MATNDEFNAAQEQMNAQIDALEAQKDALRAAHNPPSLLPREFQVQYNNRYNNQVARIQSQINSIQRQSRMMEGQLRRGAVEANQAARQAEAQQKRQDALNKAADAQRKESLKETQKKLAGILGVKPDQVQDKLDSAVYDPVTHKLVVPTKSKAETKSDLDDRKRDLKALNDKAQAFGADNLATGKSVTVNPDNIFGARPLPFKQDADGNRVYTSNGKPYAVVPSGDFDALKKEYDEISARPIDSGKMVSPDTFNTVRAQIGALGGDVPEDIVGQTQALVEQRRLAQPAIDNARGFAPGLLPNERIVPATAVPASSGPNSYPALTLPAVVGTNTPAMVDNSDLLLPNITQRLPAKQLDIPQLGILPAATAQLPKQTVAVPFQTNVLGNPAAYEPSLQSVMETRMPVFRPDHVTREQEARNAYRKLAPGATDEQIDASIKRAQAALGDNADPERVRNFAVGDLKADADKRAPGLLDRMDTLGQFLPEPGFAQGGNPFRRTVVGDAIRHGYENYIAPVVSALTPPDNLSLLDQNRIRAIQSREIPADTTLEQYQEYVNKPVDNPAYYAP